MTRLIAVLGICALLALPLRAQTPPPSNDVILAKIAALEQEIAALKAQLQPTPRQAEHARAPTLAEAAAEAAKVKHEWRQSDTPFRIVGDPPPIPTTTRAPSIPPSTEQARQTDYKTAALKDEAYWKARMQDVRTKLDADRTYLAEAVGREAALDKRLHVSRDNSAYIRDRLLRDQVDAQWQDAVAEVGRLKALVTNDTRAITTAEEEARRANVPPAWLRF